MLGSEAGIDLARYQEMSEQIESLEGMLSTALQEALFERGDCFEQFKENQKMQMETKNMEIRHDIETQHLQTKIKLVSYFRPLNIAAARHIDEA